MNIINKPTNYTTFETISCGDVFVYNSTFFIKTEWTVNDCDDEMNAVRLDDGTYSYFTDRVVITPVHQDFKLVEVVEEED